MVPKEADEQKAFVLWLRLKGIAHFRVPNETYTTSYKQKSTNKALGVSAGIPDLFIAIPNVGLVAIEMKRQKTGVVSPAQKEWISTLNSLPGVEAHVARGCDEAIKIVSEIAGIKDSGLPF